MYKMFTEWLSLQVDAAAMPTEHFGVSNVAFRKVDDEHVFRRTQARYDVTMETLRVERTTAIVVGIIEIPIIIVVDRTPTVR